MQTLARALKSLAPPPSSSGSPVRRRTIYLFTFVENHQSFKRVPSMRSVLRPDSRDTLVRLGRTRLSLGYRNECSRSSNLKSGPLDTHTLRWYVRSQGEPHPDTVLLRHAIALSPLGLLFDGRTVSDASLGKGITTRR